MRCALVVVLPLAPFLAGESTMGPQPRPRPGAPASEGGPGRSADSGLADGFAGGFAGGFVGVFAPPGGFFPGVTVSPGGAVGFPPLGFSGLFFPDFSVFGDFV